MYLEGMVCLLADNITVHEQKMIHQTVLTPIRGDYDVVVAGGGASGIMAAVAAARHGVSVALIEYGPVMGGDMLAGGISWLSFFNLFGQFHTEPKQLLYGIPFEMIQKLEREGSSPGFYNDLGPETQESRGTHADREAIKQIFFHLAEENGIQVYLNTLVCGVLQEQGKIGGVILQSNTQRFIFRAKNVIDCTGDGDVAFLAGANCREFPSHGVGMAFGVSNVNFDRALDFGRSYNAMIHDCTGENGRYKGKLVKYALRTARIPELKEPVAASGIHSSFCMTISHDNEASYINGVNVPGGGNCLDSVKTTDTILDLRENIKKSAIFLQKEIPGFEKSYLSWSSPVIGPRRTRYVECEYDISQEHVQKGLIPEDSIGLFGSQDAHFLGHVIDGGKWYGIPYRALLPKFIDNMLVAGRMITSDWIAHMSTRLIGSCFLQGQAAGTAAALAVLSGCSVRELNITLLLQTLKKDNVYLEN